jgi:hypothetical protein
VDVIVVPGGRVEVCFRQNLRCHGVRLTVELRGAHADV